MPVVLGPIRSVGAMPPHPPHAPSGTLHKRPRRTSACTPERGDGGSCPRLSKRRETVIRPDCVRDDQIYNSTPVGVRTGTAPTVVTFILPPPISAGLDGGLPRFRSVLARPLGCGGWGGRMWNCTGRRGGPVGADLLVLGPFAAARHTREYGGESADSGAESHECESYSYEYARQSRESGAYSYENGAHSYECGAESRE